MKWLIIPALVFAISGPVFAETYTFPRPLGLNTDDDPSRIEDGHTPDAENVVTDEIYGVRGRKGYVAFSTESSRNLWVFPHSNGNNYIITQASGVLRASLGTSSFSITIGTISTTELSEAASFGDMFYWVNIIDGLKYWDTNLVHVASSNIKADHIAVHKGRLWLGGVSGDLRTLYVSEYLNGGNFELAVDPTDTDPARIQVQGKLDESITGLFGSLNDILIWFKRTSFGGVYGSRRSNFQSRSFSETVGCSFPSSVQDCDGALRWLSSDKRIWEFDGNRMIEISDNRQSGSRIKTLMENVVQGDLGSKSAAINTQSEWEKGTSTPTGNISTTFDVGTIRPVNAVLDDNTESELRDGEAMDTLVDGRFFISASSGLVFDTINNPSFELASVESSSTPLRWQTNITSDLSITSITRTSQNVYPICSSPIGGSFAMVMHTTTSLLGRDEAMTIELMDSDGITLLETIFPRAKTTIPSRSCCESLSYNNHNFTINTIHLGKLVRIKITSELIGANLSKQSSTATLLSDSFILTVTSGNIRSEVRAMDGNGCGGPFTHHTRVTIDAIQMPIGVGPSASSFLGATYYSSTFNYVASSPTYQMFTSSVTGYGVQHATVTFQIKSGSSTSVALTQNQNIQNNSTPTIRGLQYAQWIATVSFPYDQAGATNPAYPTRVFIKGVKLPSISTGVYTTKTVDVGENISSWGRYQIIQNENGGEIKHQVNSSTTTTFADDGWTNIEPDVTINVPVRQFIASRIIFEASTHTQIPTLQSIIYNWNEGGDPNQKVVSGYINDRYWLGVGISSSNNNAVLVYDKLNNWHKYTNIRADAMTLYSSKLYFGNTDGIFETENGYTDSGKVIPSFYRTKDINFGTYNRRKIFDELYLTTSRSSNTISVDYFVDGSTETRTLGTYNMNEQYARQNFRLPFPSDGMEQGKSLSLKYTVNGTARWDLINADLFYALEPEAHPE